MTTVAVWVHPLYELFASNAHRFDGLKSLETIDDVPRLFPDEYLKIYPALCKKQQQAAIEADKRCIILPEGTEYVEEFLDKSYSAIMQSLLPVPARKTKWVQATDPRIGSSRINAPKSIFRPKYDMQFFGETLGFCVPLFAYFSARIPGRQVTLISDLCWAGTIDEAITGTFNPDFSVDKEEFYSRVKVV